jgi:hypothetical protein
MIARSPRRRRKMKKENINLSGLLFGRWLVLHEVESRYASNGHKRKFWMCECQCINKTVREVAQNGLKSGSSKSCGCLRLENGIESGKKRKENLLGQQFNNWTVIEESESRVGEDGRRTTLWLCQCACEKSTQRLVNAADLKRGHSKSCGCIKEEGKNINHGAASKNNIHKMNKRIYDIWLGIKKRCYGVNRRGYKNYGGRGIVVCEEWLNKENGFISFYNWSMDNEYSDDLSIDRIDNNGNYEPSNCRWVTMKVQQNNRRNNLYIEIEGVRKSILEWSTEYNLSYTTLRNRIDKKWDESDMLQPNGYIRRYKKVGNKT